MIPSTFFLSSFSVLLSVASSTPSTIRIQTDITSDLDATKVVSAFVLDEAGLDHNTSFALSDNARFARASWDCGAWGTQGAIITEKVLSLGGTYHMRLARRWLLNTPVLTDGEVFATEGAQFHMGNDGKMEANAEFIMSASLYAKHVGTQDGVFDSSVGRLVCGVDAETGARSVLSGAVSDASCNLQSPAGLETEYPHLFATTLNGAFVASTEGARPNASGIVLYQNLTTSRALRELSLPLRQYKSLGGKPCWSVDALVYRAQGDKPLYTQRIDNVTGPLWFNLQFEQPIAPGDYRVELWPSSDSEAGSRQTLFESLAWISSIRNNTHGGGGSKTYLPGTTVGGASSAVLPTLGERVAAAMVWQLEMSRSSSGSLGVIKIRNANWRGVGQDNVGASSAMWDLLRSGYLDSWLNVRFIESIEAMAELQAAGLVEAVTIESDLDAIKKSFVEVFGKRSWGREGEAGSYISWIGCDHVVGAVASCDGNHELNYRIPVDIKFIPALAAAAKLDIRGLGPLGSHMDAFDRLRDSARHVNGRFKTNLIPIEVINVSLWRASSHWRNRTSSGFARREADSGGDWQIFDPRDAKDGYGQFGLTEENGGIVMSTTALVFEAGLYREMYADFSNLVQLLSEMTDQLKEAASGKIPTVPLLMGNRSILRVPISDGSIPQQLCMEARRLSDENNPQDRWHEHWCDYYKSVSWNLPGAGAFVYAFAKGLLSLALPLGLDDSSPAIKVWGVLVRLGGAPTQIQPPAWATSRWPVELIGKRIDIVGLNIGGVRCVLSCGELGLIRRGGADISLSCSLSLAPE